MNNFLVSKTLNDTHDHDTRDRMQKKQKNFSEKIREPQRKCCTFAT